MNGQRVGKNQFLSNLKRETANIGLDFEEFYESYNEIQDENDLFSFEEMTMDSMTESAFEVEEA